MTSWIFPVPPDDPADGRPSSPPQASEVLAVTFQMHEANTVVILDGPVCAHTAPHLDAELRQIEAVDRHRLVIDARGVPTLSSHGVEVLVDHASRCAAAGGELVVRDPSPITRRVLEICALADLAEGSVPVIGV
jgi:anti-anti-sigma factor